MKRIHRGRFAAVLALLLSSAGSAYASPAFPLKLGASGSRALVDQNEVPFLWVGDTAWSLIAQLKREDAEFYLDNRKDKGFSVVLANLIEHSFSANAPANFYGQRPFQGAAFSSAPNEDYFTHADFVIDSAAARGLLVLLDPLYLGFACESQGWCAEVRAASAADMRAWGRYLGQRYKDFDNIVWLIGGDTDPTSVAPKVREMVAGIRELDTRHLMTAHNQPESFAITPWPNEPWLAVNNYYTYSSTPYLNAQTAYNVGMPFVQIESAYENEQGSTAQQLRAQAYWSLLSGGFGETFGNCPLWHMGSSASWCGSVDWKGALEAPGSIGMSWLHRLFRSRAWNLLVPEFSNTILVSGAGSGASHATAARAFSGVTVIAYLPSRRQVTVAMNKVSGSQAKAWWFNPSNGTATLAGTFATAGNRSFTPPSAGDWVLVLDDAAANLPAPGTSEAGGAPPTVAVPAEVSPNPVSSASASVSVLGNDDAGESNLSYAWTAAGPSGGSAGFSPNGGNAAKHSTVTFTRAGSYVLTAVITDAQGLSVSSAVNVTVSQTLSAVAVSPASATLTPGGSQQFNAEARDQFGVAMAVQPVFSWAVDGGGTVSGSGLFTAGSGVGGPFAVSASTGGLSGAASVSISQAAPVYIGNSQWTSTYDGQNDFLNLFLFAAPQDDWIDTIEVFVQSGSGGRIKMAVYADAGGLPGALLAVSSEIASAVTGWNQATLSTPVNTIAGAGYWLSFDTDSPTLRFAYTPSGGTVRWKTWAYGSGFPSPAGSTDGPLSENWAIRAFKR